MFFKVQPTIRYKRQLKAVLRDPFTNKVRFDVQGSIYKTISYAYTHYSAQDGHRLVLT
ncbi:hypothetical protein BGZ47_004870 [Haplosporangium gracile]|nr:hypothetical protein BGZ47_004870 [Haplosporangium gracile]